MSEGMGIQDLPNEILVKVFESLDSNNLLNCTLVCRRWNELIGHSSNIMKKIPLILMPSRNSCDLIRQYRSMKMKGEIGFTPLPNMQILSDQIWPELRFLELCEWSGNPFVDNFLKFTTKLEKMKIKGSSISPWGEGVREWDSQTIHHLNNLKSVILQECDIKMLKFIGKTQLTSLKIEFINRLEYRSTQFLRDYLDNQKELEELAIKWSIDPDKQQRFRIILKNPNADLFPLKRLSLRRVDHMFDSKKNLLAFVYKFVDSLEELEMEGTLPNSLYDMIFKEFYNLETLSINDSHNGEMLYLNKLPNPSVRKLILHNNGHKRLPELVSKLPNIQTLVLKHDICYSKDLFTNISSLTMLTKLHVCGFPKQTFEGIFMPNLRTITIMRFDNTEKWDTIVKAFPNIEIFQAKKFIGTEILSKLIFEIIAKGWRQLKHFKIGDGFVALKEIFNHFLTNCESLKTVEICETAFKSIPEKEEILRNFKRDGLRFIIHSKEDFEIDEFNFDLWKDDQYFHKLTSIYTTTLRSYDVYRSTDYMMNSCKFCKICTDPPWKGMDM